MQVYEETHTKTLYWRSYSTHEHTTVSLVLCLICQNPFKYSSVLCCRRSCKWSVNLTAIRVMSVRHDVQRFHVHYSRKPTIQGRSMSKVMVSIEIRKPWVVFYLISIVSTLYHSPYSRYLMGKSGDLEDLGLFKVIQGQRSWRRHAAL